MDDGITLIEDAPAAPKPAIARRADRSAPSARVVRDRRPPILADIDEGSPWLGWAWKIIGVLAVIALGVGAVVLAAWILAAVWTFVLPLILIAAVLKSARPAHGRG